nr:MULTISPECIES: DNA cytosine methyltransferase [unclassified Novosphingobium]
MTGLLSTSALGLGLIVDSFAGGGGASTGIEAALGAAVDIAINHDEQAIRMHEANHPGTVHVNSNIWQVDPIEAVRNHPSGIRHVSLAWFSPDCKHFSKAKGGKPREKSIRDLAWVVVLWAQRVQPDVILLENVEEFRTWGPLCEEGKPIKERQGETFNEWTKQLRKAGYKIQWKELRACDYGAPTIRKRFFMIARRDGKPIVWPAPTHGKPGTPDVLAGKLKPWRSAAEIIDWSIPCPSIFERKKPLAEKTLRRIAHGIMKFVVNNPSPFIVPLTHHGSAGRSYGLDQPLPTVTGANRGEMALVSPYFARTAHGDVDKNGKRRGQPCHGPEDPFPTVLQTSDSALIVPHITKFRNGAIGHDMAEPLATVTANSFIKRPGGSAPLGSVEAVLAPIITYAQQGGANRSVEDPHHTICANSKDQNCIAVAMLERQFGKSLGADAQEPLPTVTAGGSGKTAAVMAFMQKFAENGKGYDPETPLHTVMAGAPRHAVVTAHIEQANGGPNNANLAGRAADDPLSTVATTGSQQRLVTTTLQVLGRTDGQHGSRPHGNHDGDDRGPTGRHGVAHCEEREGQDRAPAASQGGMPPEERISGGSGSLRGEAVSGLGASPDLDRAGRTDSTGTGHQSSGRRESEQHAGKSRNGDTGRESSPCVQAGLEETGAGTGCAEPFAASQGAADGRKNLSADSDSVGCVADNSLSRGHRVAAFLTKFYGAGHNGQSLVDPLGTVTVQDRFGLVTVTIGGEEYVIVDIGMRMLTPRELFNAQGFPADYIIDRDARGEPITKTAQVAKCGNSVCPPLAEALVRAQFPEVIAAQEAQAA